MDHLSLFKWVISIKPILSATVPVLKLEICPAIAFKEFAYQNPPIDYLNQLEHYEWLNMANCDKDVIINVDISIESPMSMFLQSEHIGWMSTQLLMALQKNYPFFFKIILVMKNFLWKNHFNESFQGGISSYCLAILIWAFILVTEAILQDKYQDYLLRIIEFYGTLFNPKQTGINIVMDPNISPYFPLNQNAEQGYLTIVEPITKSKTIGENAHQIENIQKALKSAFENLGSYKQIYKQKLMEYSKEELESLGAMSDVKLWKEFQKIVGENLVQNYL
eukprot:TRINITY_DN23797_c0_g1_i1.p2 TRINITY_DN23797_c0_g1~~TRINITY_DN23797_c0_g1_i1.p2  ORF type:complete len:278 (+),score=27.49 TRINITY_DN23797_c0_g1_i1:353-1186(+)